MKDEFEDNPYYSGVDELGFPIPKPTGDEKMDRERQETYILERQNYASDSRNHEVLRECKANGKVVEYEKKYLFRLLADDTYEMCLCLREPEETFVIPSTVNGKPVMKIGSSAFTWDKDFVGVYSYDNNGLIIVLHFPFGDLVSLQ